MKSVRRKPRVVRDVVGRLIRKRARKAARNVARNVTRKVAGKGGVENVPVQVAEGLTGGVV